MTAGRDFDPCCPGGQTSLIMSLNVSYMYGYSAVSETQLSGIWNNLIEKDDNSNINLYRLVFLGHIKQKHNQYFFVSNTNITALISVGNYVEQFKESLGNVLVTQITAHLWWSALVCIKIIINYWGWCSSSSL